MTMPQKLVTLFVLFVSLASWASTSPTPTVSELVDQFYSQKKPVSSRTRLFTHLHPGPIECQPFPRPEPQACLDSICAKLGRYGCDDLSEIKNVQRICRGNYGSDCVDTICGKLGRYGCDDVSEVENVARACVGNYDMGCFHSVCNRLGRYGCDDLRETEEVLKTCAGY